MIERAIETRTHGRFLIEPPSSPGPAPLLVGFHGYAEGAEAQLARMRRIPAADRWRIVSIQALHRFYQRRANEVVASWMTRQDRELAIADNQAYVAAVIDAMDREYPDAPRTVFTGFSQGVSMMFRAGAAASRSLDGVIAVGGDVPPELDAAAVGRMRRALVCRGTHDELYAPATFARDVQRLREAHTDVRPLEFAGGHEWSDDVVRAASAFLLEQWP